MDAFERIAVISKEPDPTSTEATLRRAEAMHAAGNLTEAETLYRSILAYDPDHARALQNLGLVALRTGHLAAAEGLLRRALALEPDLAEAHSNLGLVLAGLEREAEARASFYRAVALRPDYADAWSNLAILEQSKGDTVAAIGHFRRARAANPDGAAIAANLGAALIEAGEVAEGAALLEAELSRLQHVPAIHFNLGKARLLQGDLEGAIAALRQAIALDPNFPDAHHTLAHALLAAGRIEDGWREYEWRWRAKRFRVPPRDFAIARWRGESLGGKHILIWSEQGVGDKLLFAGLLPELIAMAGSVTVEIEERLVGLFRRSFPGARIVARRDPVDPDLMAAPYDWQAPLGDLPRYLRPSLARFRPLGRYLVPDPDRTRSLRRGYAAEGKVLMGLAWASRPPKALPLMAFAPVLRLAGIQWVSLQYGDHGAEIGAVESQLGVRIVRDPSVDAIADFDGSVAQTAALDGIVTIQNATLYTAGGLGLPTFALTPPEPDWRWLGQDRSPWHETVRLYRQDRDGGGAALGRLVANVEDWIAHFPR